MEYDIPYPTYIPYIGPNNAPLGVKCQGRVVTCFTMTTTPWPKAICFFPNLTSNHLRSSNLSLYRLLALLQGTFTKTRDEQCACCIRDEHACGLYLIH